MSNFFHSVTKLLYNIYLEIRSMISSNDLLYPSFVRVLSCSRPRQKYLIVVEDTEVVIEGVPRSANTFFSAWFTIAQNRPVRIAHHLHESYQVRYAEKNRIPCILLIREPLDTVISAMQRDSRVMPASHLRNYIRFYRNALFYRRRCIVATFSETISSPNTVIVKLNTEYGTDFLTLPEGRSLEVTKEVQRRDKVSLGSLANDVTRLASPSEEKARQKAELSLIVSTKYPKLLAAARELYAQAAKLT